VYVQVLPVIVAFAFFINAFALLRISACDPLNWYSPSPSVTVTFEVEGLQPLPEVVE
jgi:hypothetical protein